MIQDRKTECNRGGAASPLCAGAGGRCWSLVHPLREHTIGPTSQLFTVLKKGAVYSLVAVSMNLLNGFTGLFSLGQAGFMLLGAYTYAILTVPVAAKDYGVLPLRRLSGDLLPAGPVCRDRR
ncbi:MAG: ABC transporter permease subunit [Oscillospiraceae bacterium]